MKKITFTLFLVHFIFLTNLLGTDLSKEIQRVAFKQSKKISKIVIKVGGPISNKPVQSIHWTSWYDSAELSEPIVLPYPD